MISRKEWESEFFSRDIWDFSVNGDLEFKKGLITTKINTNDYKDIDKLTSLGFAYCEGEVDFECDISVADVNRPDLTTCNKADLDRVICIVRGLYTHSRFRAPWFSVVEREFFYKQWIINSLMNSYEDYFLVDKDGENIRGFVTLKLEDGVGRIGLMGVSKEFQCRGVGRKLIEGVKLKCLKLGVKKLKVATQLSNLPAIRFYEKNEFETSSTSLWFYKVSV